MGVTPPSPGLGKFPTFYKPATPLVGCTPPPTPLTSDLCLVTKGQAMAASLKFLLGSSTFPLR